MEKRFVVFLVLAFGILSAHMYVTSILWPPKAKVAAKGPESGAKKAEATKKAAPKAEKEPAKAPEKAPAPKEGQANEGPAKKAETPKVKAAAPQVPVQWVTIGSGDPASPYRMLVTLTNRGAAVERIELNTLRFHDAEDLSGYLGYLAEVNTPTPRGGCILQVVGRGTPADLAGLKRGDVITAVDGRKVDDASAFHDVLRATRPNRELKLAVLRDGKDLAITATTGRRPMAVIRPEHHPDEPDDPLSLLMTLQKIDDVEIPKGSLEIPGVKLKSGNWELLPGDATQVAFRQVLPEQELEVVKRYRVEKIPAADSAERDNAYHLNFEIEIRNLGTKARKIAYQLDGPNGLPTDGWWYASKVSTSWGATGLRDVVVGFVPEDRVEHKHMSGLTIADDKAGPAWRDQSLTYIGVDAQFFAAVLLPQKSNLGDNWFAESQPLLVGPVPKDASRKKLVNVSCRVTSVVHELPPGGKPLKQQFQLFAGPKRPDLLAKYGLDSLVYYGWFGWVAKPMLVVLHFFYRLVGNYGLAIILLTVLVRSCMFPLSRKQALNAQKMQELQPEIKKIQEKHKGNVEQRSRAQQELFRKHNYNPLSGCGVMFLQLPIFIGLYRSLMVDVELYQEPLLSTWIRWCSDLAAPDMLWHWADYLPAFLAGPTGWLGPYLNVLPLVTIALFLWQQKMFMPPPADEQAAMQQKIMSYMMIFIGVMFFKVASGLCIYFIASSAWGIAERKLLPKMQPAGGAAPSAAAPVSSNGTGSTKKGGKKQRGKR
ncbi:MAG: YidC/Oxa1 family insertase periplasmic-domain containing protein [Pirellulales bacterium]